MEDDRGRVSITNWVPASPPPSPPPLARSPRPADLQPRAVFTVVYRRPMALEPAEFSVRTTLAKAAQSAREELTAKVEIVENDHVVPDVASMAVVARRWIRMKDVVVVVVDMKNSTRLTWSKRATTSARIYEAITGNCVRLIKTFDADFVDIQGDGLFAVFGGDLRYERAMCAAITLRTFSEQGLVPGIEAHISEKARPEIGLKVGVASGTLAVKRIGKARDQSEPVWAGKPVNWASKCAGAADRHQTVVTRRVFEHFAENDWVRYSCNCAARSDLWSTIQVETLPEDDQECFVLESKWCEACGDEFCRAVLERAARPAGAAA